MPMVNGDYAGFFRKLRAELTILPKVVKMVNPGKWVPGSVL